MRYLTLEELEGDKEKDKKQKSSLHLFDSYSTVIIGLFGSAEEKRELGEVGKKRNNA